MMVIQRPLLEAQIEESFQKSFYRKKAILGKKYKKNWKSKNDLKSRKRALNKELCAIYLFFINLKFDDCQKYDRITSKNLNNMKNWISVEIDPINLTSKNNLKTPP